MHTYISITTHSISSRHYVHQIPVHVRAHPSILADTIPVVDDVGPGGRGGGGFVVGWFVIRWGKLVVEDWWLGMETEMGLRKK